MEYIDSFRKRILGNLSSNSGYFLLENTSEQIHMNLNIFLPKSIEEYYKKIKSVSIEGPRQFEMFPLEHIYFVDEKHLAFSKIGNNLICFNTSELNTADEWDIICKYNDYLITKTLASYLTNKVWAWIDRGREIWKDEF